MSRSQTVMAGLDPAIHAMTRRCPAVGPKGALDKYNVR